MQRILDMPPESTTLLGAILRPAIVADIADGLSEDAIYASQVGIAIRSARLVGRDESDVEVAASLARSLVAGILAELREDGVVPVER